MDFNKLAYLLVLLSSCSATPVWNETSGQWEYSEGDKPNSPDQIGSQTGFFEGDINGIHTNGKLRNGIFKADRWPNGIIPYAFASTFSDVEIVNIANAMKSLHAKTCLKIIPRTDQKDYIYFENTATGCNSYIGRVGGGQRVSIQRGTFCTKQSSIMHELLHAAGLYHEHSRYDRDPYITINLANVASSKKDQFRKVSNSDSYTYGAPFDYYSIMLYQRNAAAINPNINVIITTDKSKQNVIGNVLFPSYWDYYKINKIYECTAISLPCSNYDNNCGLYASYCDTVKVRFLCPKMCGAC